MLAKVHRKYCSLCGMLKKEIPYRQLKGQVVSVCRVCPRCDGPVGR